jgi:hypothetical protein
MSLVELYSIESKFNEKRKEYISLMDSINFSCLGKETKNKECLRASKLNADMQTSLLQMSNMINKKTPSPLPLNIQHAQFLKITDKLEKDMNELIQNESIEQDTINRVDTNKTDMIIWTIGAIVVSALVIYQYKKI